MKRTDEFKWSISLQWSEEDEGYIALIHELPGHSAFGETPERAVKEARIAAELYVETLKDDGRPIPKPNLMQEYSGQLRLRMPRHLHAQLAAFAEQEGMSLNSYIVYLLTRASTSAKAPERVRRPVAAIKRKTAQPRRLARTG